MSPTEIVQSMMQTDRFSQWLGIKVLTVTPGSCQLHMTVTKDMVNGMGNTHGGISFSFADSALAFASNSHGIKAVSIETSISHVRPSSIGDELTAVARELHCGRTIAVYEITVTNQHQKVVALFKGTVHRTDINW